MRYPLEFSKSSPVEGLGSSGDDGGEAGTHEIATRQIETSETGAGEPVAPESALLQRLAATSIGPLSRLSETIDLTLEQVAAWMAEPVNRERVGNLVRLLDAQSQLLLCQQRTLAVARLARVAAEDTAPPETVRRACKDLLSVRLIDPYREDQWQADRPSAPPAAPSPDMQAMILSQFDRLEEAERCALESLAAISVNQPRAGRAEQRGRNRHEPM